MVKYILCLATIVMVFLGCTVPVEVDNNAWTNQAQVEDTELALIPVGAALGGPFATVLCPDDKNPATAEDIRRVVAALLRNDTIAFAEREVEYTYVDPTATAALPPIATPNLATGNAWTATSVKIDIPNCKENDDIKVRVWGSWQLNTTSNATTVGRARVGFYLDPLGTPLLVGNVKGIATISDDGGALNLPHNENYFLEYRYRVTGPLPTDPVTVRAVLEARSEDLSGGAGTATMVFLHSARMDVTHVKRTIP